MRSAVRKFVVIATAWAMSAFAAAPVGAVSFTFDTSGGNNTLVNSQTFKSNTVGGMAVNMQVTAWHWNNTGAAADDNKIVAAKLGLWSPGLGVIDTASGETTAGNQHQIDNINGVDFLMLQFDRPVSLSGIGRAVFDLGFDPDDSDAAYWADSAKLLGTPAWTSSINLTPYSVDSSSWKTVLGNQTSGTTTVPNAPWASVWLIGADPRDAVVSARNDGFKLSSLEISAVGVPEPATWGMMVVGFGLIGCAIRRRSGRLAFGSIA